MDLGAWSFVLSCVGVLLGLISAYARISYFTKKAAKALGGKAETWLEQKNAEADFFIQYPSALIAFSLRNALALVLIVVLGIKLLDSIRDGSNFFPPSFAPLVALLLAYLCTEAITGITSTNRHVLRRARQRFLSESIAPKSEA